jgi:hypothetical protein
MMHVLIVAAALILAAASSTAGAEGRPSEKTITVCRPEYTPDGNRDSWQASYSFRLTTDGLGAVKEVGTIHSPKPIEFIREGRLVECMKTWRLDADARYVVIFSLGTSSVQNDIWIRKYGGETTRLILR